jgi:RNA polymerase sigma-70 factor (ECF subfamily)
MFNKLFKTNNSFDNIIYLSRNYDKKWLTMLYEKFSKKIYNYIYSRVSNLEDCENITSKVWEKICKNINKFEWEIQWKFEAWIITISKNEISSYYRKNKIISDQIEEYENFQDDKQTPEEFAREKSGNNFILNQINELSEKQAECIRLKYFDWYKNKEIAVLLDIKEPSVASNLNRWLEKLKLTINI